MLQIKRQATLIVIVAMVAMSCSRQKTAGEHQTPASTETERATAAAPSAQTPSVSTPASSTVNAPVSPGAMTEKWQSDFSVFASEVEKLRKTKQGETSLESATGSRYENKQVKWTLTFKGISHNGDKDTVDFDLEPFGIKYKFFSSTRLIMAGFEPSPAAVPGWKNMKPGTHVGFAGVCESVSMLTMTPAGGVPRVVALVTVSGVTPITTAASPSVTGTASGKEPAKDVAKGLTGRWRFLMRTQTWTVQLAPRSGLPDEYKGLARREERDEKGEVVTMELGAALDGGKLKAWLGPGFVVCEAAFRAAPSLQGECKAMDGNTGPFRADRLAQGK